MYCRLVSSLYRCFCHFPCRCLYLCPCHCLCLCPYRRLSCPCHRLRSRFHTTSQQTSWIQLIATRLTLSVFQRLFFQKILSFLLSGWVSQPGKCQSELLTIPDQIIGNNKSKKFFARTFCMNSVERSCIVEQCGTISCWSLFEFVWFKFVDREVDNGTVQWNHSVETFEGKSRCKQIRLLNNLHLCKADANYAKFPSDRL